jgi:hypothetical protein
MGGLSIYKGHEKWRIEGGASQIQIIGHQQTMSSCQHTVMLTPFLQVLYPSMRYLVHVCCHACLGFLVDRHSFKILYNADVCERP